MTPTRALQLADDLIENHKGALEPVVKLLFAFKAWSGDPLGEATMSAVLKRLYSDTDHCEEVGLTSFVREGDDTQNTGINSASSLPA